MTQIGGDSQNTMPIAINSGLAARQIVKAGADPAAKFSMDAFKQSITTTAKNPKSLLDATSKNLIVSDALAQQSFVTRLAAKIPFVRSFLGPDFILNEAIGKLGKDALGGLTKTQVTNIALEGGDVAKKLVQAGMPAEAAQSIAAKGAERLAALGGSAATQTVAKTVATSAVDDVVKSAAGLGLKKGFQTVSEEAIRGALTGPNSLEALKKLGFYAKDAKSLVAQAATKGTETAVKTAANEAGQAVAQTSAKGGLRGFFGKLLGGVKGNFIVAGVFSLASNAIQLAQGKMGIKQFLGLTVLDTAAYGAIGWGSAAAGAAIGSVVPGLGTVVGFLAGLAIGFVGGMIYEKVVRNPVKDMLGGSPAGGTTNGYDPNAYTPPTNGYSPSAPTPGADMSYEEAMRQIERLGQGR